MPPRTKIPSAISTLRSHLTWHELRTMVTYVIVGMCNTGVFVGITTASAHWGVDYRLYTTYGYTIAMLVSFMLNRCFTFAHGQKQQGAHALSKFLLSNLSLLGLVHVVQYVLIERMHWRHLFGIGAGMVFYTGLGYLLNRNWVFRAGKKQRADS